MRVKKVQRERLGPEDSAPWGDAQAARELLVGQEAGHRRIADQRLGLVGVERGDQLGQWGGGRRLRRCLGVLRPGVLQRGEQLAGEVQPAGGGDRGHPVPRPEAGANPRAHGGGDPDGGLVLGERDDAPHAGGARGRQHPVPARERPRRVRARHVRLQVDAAQPRVADKLVEVVHQGGLGQGGQLGQRPVGGVGAEGGAVVARVADRVLQQRAQPPGLVDQEPLARPAVAGQQLAGQPVEPVEQAGRPSGEGRGWVRVHGRAPFRRRDIFWTTSCLMK
jgi:hypothetical protein